MVKQLTHLAYKARLAALLEETNLSRFGRCALCMRLWRSCSSVVGIAGISIPGFPGTLFLLIALWLAGRSNERLYRWMLTNRMFGRQLVDYESGFGIPRRIKYLIVAVIIGFTLFALMRVDTAWVVILDVALAVYGVWYVWTRPTREDVVAELGTTV